MKLILSEVLDLTNLEYEVLLQKTAVDKIWNDMSLHNRNVCLGVITISMWLSAVVQYYLEKTMIFVA